MADLGTQILNDMISYTDGVVKRVETDAKDIQRQMVVTFKDIDSVIILIMTRQTGDLPQAVAIFPSKVLTKLLKVV